MTGAQTKVLDSKESTDGCAQYFLEKVTFKRNFLKEINLEVFAVFPPDPQPHLGEIRERLPRRSIENTPLLLLLEYSFITALRIPIQNICVFTGCPREIVRPAGVSHAPPSPSTYDSARHSTTVELRIE